MPKFKVKATMDVGYEVFIEASSEDEAWKLADEMDGPSDIDDEVWTRVDNGHDWTMEGICEMSDEKNAVFTVKDLKDRLNQVGLPFDEVESGSDGVICLVFATDDEEYNDGWFCNEEEGEQL